MQLTRGHSPSTHFDAYITEYEVLKVSRENSYVRRFVTGLQAGYIG